MLARWQPGAVFEGRGDPCRARFRSWPALTTRREPSSTRSGRCMEGTNMTKQARLLAQGTSAIALALVAAPAVFAQDMPQATNTPPAAGVSTGSDTQANGSAVATDSEIVVTGSRLARSSFNSPTPVNVVGQDRVQNLNITSVGDALNQIPSFRPITTPST